MALDYQKAMYSKEKIEEIQDRQRRWRQQYPAHLNYANSGGYDDLHKSFLRFQKDAGTQNGFPQFGPPRLKDPDLCLWTPWDLNVFISLGLGRPGLADMTLIRDEDIPGCNLTHRLAQPPKTMIGGRFKPRERQPKQLGSHELEAFKGTESGNWHLMR
ncbi:hypothetical protein LSH36_852g01021 [Paralvinella palmiformis]|uniref:Uncharacterized protein n=1 Tax=Paralvinella palmiformis TaxID=53620 RepID=A0AAD9MRR6_9ANNE|nr:hypothetical protein LSH36_852g01021 [Paralvinella palmiformis]